MDFEFLLFGKEQPKPKEKAPVVVPSVFLFRSNDAGAWHKRDCSFIRDSTHLQACSLERLPNNYTRCARCNPPIKKEPYREAGQVVYVYVGLRGTKYHNRNCRQLESSIRYDIRDLPAEYDRCASCMPVQRP